MMINAANLAAASAANNSRGRPGDGSVSGEAARGQGGGGAESSETSESAEPSESTESAKSSRPSQSSQSSQSTQSAQHGQQPQPGATPQPAAEGDRRADFRSALMRSLPEGMLERIAADRGGDGADTEADAKTLAKLDALLRGQGVTLNPSSQYQAERIEQWLRLALDNPNMLKELAGRIPVAGAREIAGQVELVERVSAWVMPKGEAAQVLPGQLVLGGDNAGVSVNAGIGTNVNTNTSAIISDNTNVNANTGTSVNTNTSAVISDNSAKLIEILFKAAFTAAPSALLGLAEQAASSSSSAAVNIGSLQLPPAEAQKMAGEILSQLPGQSPVKTEFLHDARQMSAQNLDAEIVLPQKSQTSQTLGSVVSMIRSEYPALTEAAVRILLEGDGKAAMAAVSEKIETLTGLAGKIQVVDEKQPVNDKAVINDKPVVSDKNVVSDKSIVNDKSAVNEKPIINDKLAHQTVGAAISRPPLDVNDKPVINDKSAHHTVGAAISRPPLVIARHEVTHTPDARTTPLQSTHHQHQADGLPAASPAGLPRFARNDGGLASHRYENSFTVDKPFANDKSAIVDGSAIKDKKDINGKIPVNDKLIVNENTAISEKSPVNDKSAINDKPVINDKSLIADKPTHQTVGAATSRPPTDMNDKAAVLAIRDEAQRIITALKAAADSINTELTRRGDIGAGQRVNFLGLVRDAVSSLDSALSPLTREERPVPPEFYERVVSAPRHQVSAEAKSAVFTQIGAAQELIRQAFEAVINTNVPQKPVAGATIGRPPLATNNAEFAADKIANTKPAPSDKNTSGINTGISTNINDNTGVNISNKNVSANIPPSPVPDNKNSADAFLQMAQRLWTNTEKLRAHFREAFSSLDLQSRVSLLDPSAADKSVSHVIRQSVDALRTGILLDVSRALREIFSSVEELREIVSRLSGEQRMQPEAGEALARAARELGHQAREGGAEVMEKMKGVLRELNRLQADVSRAQEKGDGAHGAERASPADVIRSTALAAARNLESLQMLAAQTRGMDVQQQLIALPVKIGQEWTEVQVKIIKDRAAKKKAGGADGRVSVYLNVAPSKLGQVTAHLDFHPPASLKLSFQFEKPAATKWFREQSNALREALSRAGLPGAALEFHNKRAVRKEPVSADVGSDTDTDANVKKGRRKTGKVDFKA